MIKWLDYSENCNEAGLDYESGRAMDDLMTCCQTKPGGCLIDEGDCDADYECAEGLKCGYKNCN